MPYTASFGTIQSQPTPLPAPKPDSLFRIGILGDFSGRQFRGKVGTSAEIAARRLFRVGRDSLDDVINKLAIDVKVPVGADGTLINLRLSSLEHFHPDSLHDRVEQIADLYDADEKSALMNGILHSPHFQALESAWRGLDWFLVRAVKSSLIEVVLVDISLPELEADLKSSENLNACGVHQLLIDKCIRGPKGVPWAVMVANYLFDPSGQHVELLGRLAKIFAQSSAPILTSLDPQVLEPTFTFSADASPAWQELRKLPEAVYLGLALPRFLLRIPFGENSQPIEKFSFEEATRPPDRNHYVWGNPALGCAVLLAQGFHKDGWGFKPGAILDLEKLPIHVYTVDDEQETTLAEAWLVRPQTEQLIKKGFMPFQGVQGEGAMKLARFLSVALPPKDQQARDLRGRWSQPGAAPAARPAPTPAAPKAGMVSAMPPPPPRTPPPAPAPTPAPAAAKAAPPPKPAPAPPAAPPPAAGPAEEEMDPDLAALLKGLE